MNTHNSHVDVEPFSVFGPEDIHRPRISYTLSEAAATVGVSLPLFRKLAVDGSIPIRYANSKPIVLASELEQWLDALPTTPQMGGKEQDASASLPAVIAAHRTGMDRTDRPIPTMIDAFGPTNVYAPPIAFTVAGAAAAVGIGPTLLREQIRLGVLQARYVNSKPIVTAEALKDWLDSLPTFNVKREI